MEQGQIDPKLQKTINITKKVLGKHISKPVLADKYLGRPPFRFLLEIVNNVIQQTSFMKDVFSPNELKYENISTADEKRVILKKVIEAIENETEEKCDARTSKILSGKEPEKTNEMLQLLAKAISSFASKSKQRNSNEVKTSEKPTTSSGNTKENDADKREPAADPSSKDDNKSASENKIESVKSSSKVAAPSASKKLSTNTTSINVKRKPSGDKINTESKLKPSTAKASPSCTSTKIASHDIHKPKAVGSPSASSSSLIAQRKASSSNLVKSQSRQSLSIKSSTSSIKLASLSDHTKNNGKQQQEHQLEVSSQDKEQQKLEEPAVPVIAAMPPETNAEVPLQRPVTRTKYRQKTSENEAETLVDKDGMLKTLPSNELVTIAGETGDKEVSDPSVQEIDKKETASCGVRSGRSSSSEEVVTEHMNEIITEWKSTSARTEEAQQIEEQEQVPHHNKGLTHTGWIKDEPEAAKVSRTKSSMNRVFESVENFNVDGSLNRGGQSDTSTRASETTTAFRDDKNVLKRPITVLRDNESDDEEDDAFLVQEKIESERDMALERLQQGAILRNTIGSSSMSLDITYLPPEHRGLLVNQIIETQRELEKLSSSNPQYRHGGLLENELAERDKAAMREVYLKQIEDLREAIQKMSKCANPLANIIQRSQDDACLMEIEFKKLRQENERLQKKIDEAKAETTKLLYPLTEELSQLDTRIEKVEGAIVLAKQRLALIDSEYTDEFIAQLESTPTEDEVLAGALEDDPILQFRATFAGNSDKDDEGGGMHTKSLMDVFTRAVDMHEGSGDCGHNLGKQHFQGPIAKSKRTSAKPVVTSTPPRCEKRLLNRTVYGDDSPMGRRTNRILRQLEQEEPSIDKENKPSWWD